MFKMATFHFAHFHESSTSRLTCFTNHFWINVFGKIINNELEIINCSRRDSLNDPQKRSLAYWDLVILNICCNHVPSIILFVIFKFYVQTILNIHQGRTFLLQRLTSRGSVSRQIDVGTDNILFPHSTSLPVVGTCKTWTNMCTVRLESEISGTWNPSRHKQKSYISYCTNLSLWDDRSLFNLGYRI